MPLFRRMNCLVAALLCGAAALAAPNAATNLWWSLRPLVRPTVPASQTAAPENPIDAFLFSKLEASGLTFSPEASRQTLIRRAYFDLIGLPPTPEEVQRFVHDSDPQAYGHLIERLLDLPQY